MEITPEERMRRYAEAMRIKCSACREATLRRLKELGI